MPALSNRRGLIILLCLFLVCASWGSCYLFIELALRSIPPFLLTATRIGCAGLIMFPALRLLGHREKPTLQDVKFAFCSAFFMSVLSAGLMTVGQQYIPSGTVAMIMGSVPLWMVIAGWLFLKEKKPTAKQAFGLVLGTGCVVLLGYRQGSVGMGSAFGMLCLALNITGIPFLGLMGTAGAVCVAIAVLIVLLLVWRLVLNRRRYRYGRSVGRSHSRNYRGRRR